MKRSAAILFSCLLGQFGFAQTVAQDWTKIDCNGNTWHLFGELDNQKVIIMEFVMPCSSCTTGGNTLEQIYQEYNFNYPGRILSFGIADNNSTSCATMNSWVFGNAFSFIPFNNGASQVAYYGGAGMPTVVVVGGGYSHKVFYRKISFNGPTEDANVRAAMDSALLAANGIQNGSDLNLHLSLFPNPANENAAVTYALNNNNNIEIGLYDLLGERLALLFSGDQIAGEHTVNINCAELAEGFYFVKLNTDSGIKSIGLTVQH